jgi:glycoside/pentoside/hexuronide:cation symporter, GPH family
MDQRAFLPAADPASQHKRVVSTTRLLAYSAPALPLAVMLIPLNALLPFFYNSVIGIQASMVGLALLISRLGDVFVDPLCGYLSDKTGSRRAWIVAGVPVFVAGAATLFFPPQQAGMVWLLASSAVLYVGWTMIQLPYQAWGAEAITEYKQRTRLSGIREAASIVGVVVAAAIPMFSALLGHGIDRFTMSLLGGFLVIAMPLTVLIALPSLPDQPLTAPNMATGKKFRLSELMTFRAPFLRILIAFLFFGFGKGVANAMTVYYANFVLRAPEVVGYVLFSAYAGVLVATPGWVWLANRFGKHRVIAASLALTVIALVSLALGLGPGDGWRFVALEFFIGLLAAGYLVIPPAMVADAVDYDTLKGGQERFGLHFATWSMMQKLVFAVSIGLVLPALDWVGFDPHAAATPAAIDIVRALYLIAPMPLYLAAALLLWGFPINAKRHRIIRACLERRGLRDTRRPI